MRKIISLVVLSTAFILIGCDDYKSNYKDTALEVIEAVNYSFGCDGGEGYVTVKTAQTVEAKPNVDWIETTVKNNTVHYKVQRTDDLDSRSGIIYISAGGLEASVNIMQMGSYYTLETYSLSFEFGEESKEINVVTNSDIVSYVVEKKPEDDWFSLSTDKNTITVKVDENKGDTPRNSYFNVIFTRVSGETETKKVVLEQDIKPFADILVGTWNVKQILVDNSVQKAYNMAYNITITKVNKNEVSISGFLPIFTNLNFAPLKGTVDGNKLIINTSTLTPSIYNSYKTVVAPMASDDFNKGFPNNKLTLTVEKPTPESLLINVRGGFVYEDPDDPTYKEYYSYFIGAIDNDGKTLLDVAYYAFNETWTKLK